MDFYPKINSVKPIKNKCLLVIFNNGIKNIYDCAPLLKEKAFSSLTNDELFRSVKADKGGHGISWNDEIDLSESELWIHGLPAEQTSFVNC